MGILANEPYAKGVFSLSFSPDGAWLVSGSWDGKLRIYDVQTRVVLREFTAAPYGAGNVAVSPDGSRLVTWGIDIEQGSNLFLGEVYF